MLTIAGFRVQLPAAFSRGIEVGMALLLDQIFKKFISIGSLNVYLPSGRLCRYQGRLPGPHAAVRIKTAKAVKGLLLNSGLAFGEGWMDGDIEAVDCSLEAALARALCR